MAANRRLQAVSFFAAALFLFAAPVSAWAGGTEPEIGFMKVTVMPEYDSTAVLVIEEGKFADKSMFPRDIVFNLPPDVTKLTDVCSLSPNGHHFCQLFEIKKGPDKNVMNLKLPYSDFFIDFQYAPFQAKQNAGRDFSFPVEPYYNVKEMVIMIQKPFRAANFNINPASTETVEKEGYQYAKYRFQNVKAGELKNFRVAYFKGDANPSINTQYSAMAKTHIFQSHSAEIILGAGVVGLAAIWVIRKKKAGA